MTLRILSGQFKGQKLVVPKTARPTLGITRQAIFDKCQVFIEGAVVLDLFSGSGAIGLEALSRYAKNVTFVEKDPISFNILKKNIAHLDCLAQSSAICGDVLKVISTLPHTTFDIIYADPPYTVQKSKGAIDSLALNTLKKIDQYGLLKDGGVFFLEDTLGFDFDFQPKCLILREKKRYGRSKLLIYEKKF
jgi:16S rRNA (guanine966-N2)-methyltransferase